jgi:hypothetical protein
MPSEEDLGPLIFPLVQIMFGVLAASPSEVYIPLHLHVISCLQQLAAHSEHFIPTASKLTDILELHAISQPPTASTDGPPKFLHLVRLPVGSVTKAPVRDVIVQAVMNMIRYDTEIYRFHVGLPEYLYLTTKKLKAFLKKTKINRWRDTVRALTHHLEQYSAFARDSRQKLGLPPMEVKGFEPLKPATQSSSSQRLIKLMSSDKGHILATQGDESSVIVVSGGMPDVPAKGQLRAATSVVVKRKAKKGRNSESDSDSEEDEDAGEESQEEEPSDGESESNDGDDDEEDTSAPVLGKRDRSRQANSKGLKKDKTAAKEDVLTLRDEVGDIDWSDDDN